MAACCPQLPMLVPSFVTQVPLQQGLAEELVLQIAPLGRQAVLALPQVPILALPIVLQVPLQQGSADEDLLQIPPFETHEACALASFGKTNNERIKIITKINFFTLIF